MSRQQMKAAQYIRTLDEARCSGDWNAVPELVRKIRKHAPERTCLTLAAECEHAVTQTTLGRTLIAPTGTAKPPAAPTGQPQPIAKYIPQLLTAIEDDQTHVEDGFQAQVCLGWLHWHLGEPALAAGRLPKNIGHDLAQLDGPNKQLAEWTKVCALKACYLKGCALAKTGAVAEAHECFESGLPIFVALSPKQKQWKEVLNWMEVFLTGFCMLSSQAIKTRVTSPMEPESLAAFRTWGAFCESQGSATVAGRAPQTDVSRLRVWKEYYTTLSDLLRQGLPFPPSHSTNTQLLRPSSRPQQRAELKQVEAKYETILLNELQFPTADKSNQEVEAFLELVMQNWDILCGGSWKDADLGDGGGEAVSRRVLEVLYRAATKTFHSTPILRHLFSVHLSLAEFDLAFKAFDTYMDIVTRTKERIEQTGDAEPGLDDDETVLQTASECIKALCRYGSRQGAEKAKDIGQFFEDWLNKHHPTPLQSGKSHSQAIGGEDEDQLTAIAPKVFALAWRCIGISHAQWARLTFDAPSRSDIQLKAIKCFRKSLLPEFESTNNIETLFALGTILAERRELTTAVELVRFGLLPPSSNGQSHDLGSHAGQFARERSLIPLWHLMALLLSARQEFSMAARSCEGAFEQFKDPRNLFGAENFNQSDHINEKSLPGHYGVVDEMDDFEKQNVIEVKLTQLTLIEVLEGPEIAVNSSGELLTLYSRLFGDPSKDIIPPVASNAQVTAPPSSSSGTMRSLKGSIFGRSVRKSLPPVAHGENLGTHQRSNTAQTVPSQAAPAIQVTNENGRETNRPHITKNHRPEKQKGGESVPYKKSSGNMRQRAASAAQRNMSIETGPTAQVVDGEEFFTPPGDVEKHSQWLDPGQRASQVGLAISPDNISIEDSQGSNSTTLSPKEAYFKPVSSDPEKAQCNQLPSVIPYYSSPFTSRVTRFPRPQQRHQRTAILVKVWLLISGFYRRAEMYRDAKGSIEEAHKLVQSLGTGISGDNVGNQSAPTTGWGGGKSVKELLADICAERGSLAVAESLPYAALGHFETALTHFADHPAAIVGLSKILADIYNEDLLPLSSIPSIAPSSAQANLATNTSMPTRSSSTSAPNGALGMSGTKAQLADTTPSTLPPKHPEVEKSSAALLDRVAARDRAYGLLSTLTRLGTGWNHSEAWFALAQSYELGGQLEKSRECLWWCVELEEALGVRDWSEVLGGMSRGGYVL